MAPLRKGTLVALALLAAAGARAEPVAVASIVDGDTVTLADGRTVRLAGIEAPKPPLRREEGRAYPLAEQATDALADLVGRGLVELRGEAPGDRHGRTVAHLWRADGVWIEGELLRRGLVRVHTTADDRSFAREMLAVEAEARDARRGLWRLDAFAVREAETLIPAEGFHLVEGRIVTAAKPKGDVYLDFGEDWRTDFTVLIPRKALRLFKQAALDPLAWTGRRIRVRGWVFSRNGPMIEATHPEQIEFLENPSPRAGEGGVGAPAQEDEGAAAR